MNSWFGWGAFALTALVLGVIGCHFSLRVLRIAAAFVALTTVVCLTWYGLTYPVQAPGSFSDALARGADALTIAFFHPLPVPHEHPRSRARRDRLAHHRRPARDRLPGT